MEKHYKLKNILTDIIFNLKKQDFLVYFRKISIVKIEDNKIVFGTVSSFMKDNLKAKFHNILLEATRNEFWENIASIEFIVDNTIDNPSNTDAIDCQDFYKENTKTTKKAEKKSRTGIAPIEKKGSVNNRYTLGNFIVGWDNQLAFSACEAVTKNPGKSYNPLYIYWDVGLGNRKWNPYEV
jgi:chromosomal replication initiator protein